MQLKASLSVMSVDAILTVGESRLQETPAGAFTDRETSPEKPLIGSMLMGSLAELPLSIERTVDALPMLKVGARTSIDCV